MQDQNFFIFIVHICK